MVANAQLVDGSYAALGLTRRQGPPRPIRRNHLSPESKGLKFWWSGFYLYKPAIDGHFNLVNRNDRNGQFGTFTFDNAPPNHIQPTRWGRCYYFDNFGDVHIRWLNSGGIAYAPSTASPFTITWVAKFVGTMPTGTFPTICMIKSASAQCFQVHYTGSASYKDITFGSASIYGTHDIQIVSVVPVTHVDHWGVITNDGSSLDANSAYRAWVNGHEFTVGSSGSFGGQDNSTKINDATNANWEWLGPIYDVRFYDRAWSPQEAKRFYRRKWDLYGGPGLGDVLPLAAAGPSASLAGSLADGGTEAEIEAGTETLEIDLAGGATWSDPLTTTNKNDLIAGLDSDGGTGAGTWNTEVRDGGVLTASDVTRTSATKVTIDMPAIADYGPGSAETITVTVPASTNSHTADLTAGTFDITDTVAGGPPPYPNPRYDMAGGLQPMGGGIGV